jgi:UDP-N-acetylmuramoyl-L-alanyl-D-glutamate--2,6-diaminopimelate ligase
MRLESLADILNVGEGAWQTVSGITQDSRKAVTGSLFFALAGTKIDGAKFAADAVEGGAIAVVCAHGMDVGSLSVPVIRVADPRLSLALCAARFYANQPETMIAVTGTAGKTPAGLLLPSEPQVLSRPGVMIMAR